MLRNFVFILLLYACGPVPPEPALVAGESTADDPLLAPASVAAPPAEAITTASGLAYRVLTPGTGTESPTRRDTVTVHYTGWQTDGTRFDSSIERGTPASFPLTGVIRGWTEGLQLMVAGEKTRFWIPESLAYSGQAGKPEGMLVFDIELISIEASAQTTREATPTKPPDAPENAATPPADAQTLGDGSRYITTQEPRAPRQDQDRVSPEAGDKVDIRFNAWTQAGVHQAGTAKRGRPETLAIDSLSSGWSQALTQMAEGQKIQLWTSAEASSTVAVPVSSAMVYELELLRVKKSLPAPSNVAAPPAEALTTASGLAYTILKRGTGTETPNVRAEVEVHYSGWTTDGEMFDSSITRGQPQTFKPTQVIPGWTEGLQLMAEGDQYRFWIPEALAYQGRKGKPAGMLVFDVELLQIKSNPPPPPSAPADANSPPAAAVSIKDGVQYLSLSEPRAGGNTPTPESWVQIHVIDWTQAGEYLGGTDETGEPIVRPMEALSPAWQETLSEMREGQKVRIWSSQDQSGVGRRTAPGDMVTELTLVQIGPTPETPSDVGGPPVDALTTATGLRYKRLRAGTGVTRPAATNEVEVHYSGWTTDGALFDSSARRLAPAEFPLSRVIPGWTEGLQLMVTGEKTRFWIPEELAYKGQAGKPLGMLVFDVELISIK